MRMTYDSQADAGYVYLVEQIGHGEVARSQPVELEHGCLVVDLDADGRLLGIEVLGAASLLRKETIAAAQNISSTRSDEV